MNYKVEHIHASGRQLNIILLDVLDRSEYSDTNISNFFLIRCIIDEISRYAAVTRPLIKGWIPSNKFSVIIIQF